MKPTRRIAQWLRDYDHRLEIHWSNVVSAWVIERKGRIDPKVLFEMKRRLNISYDNTETGSEQKQEIIDNRLRARMEIEAMERGNRWLFAVPHPLEEEALKKLIVGSDTWREGSPEHMDADKAAKRATDPVYERMEAERRRKLKAVQELYRYRLRDYAPHFFRRLGLRSQLPGNKKQLA